MTVSVQPYAETPLPTELRQVVLSVAGVKSVYPWRPLWQRLPGQAAALLTNTEAEVEDVPLVETFADGPTEVSVRVGVSSDARTPAVVRAVSAAVRTHLEPEQVAVKVVVVRIAAGPEPE